MTSRPADDPGLAQDPLALLGDPSLSHGDGGLRQLAPAAGDVAPRRERFGDLEGAGGGLAPAARRGLTEGGWKLRPRELAG